MNVRLLVLFLSLGLLAPLPGQDFERSGRQVPAVQSWAPTSYTAGRRLGDQITLSNTTELYRPDNGTVWWRGATWPIAYSAEFDEFATLFNLKSSGQLLVSPDGSYDWAWTGGTGVMPSAIVGSDSLWLMGMTTSGGKGDTYYYTSTDQGASWTQRSQPGTGPWIYYWNGTIFLLYKNSSTTAWTSSDGVNWTSRTCISLGGISDVSYANGVWLITQNGSSTYATSADAVTWTSRTNGAGSFGNSSAVVVGSGAVAWFQGAGLWVASGTAFGGYMTSPDAITWTARTLPISFLQTSNGFKFATDGTALLVSGQSGKIARSTDGINWSASLSLLEPTQNLGGSNPDIFWWSGTKFIWNGFSLVYTSPDGLTWTRRQLCLGSLLPIGPRTERAFTKSSRYLIIYNDVADATPRTILHQVSSGASLVSTYVRIK